MSGADDSVSMDVFARLVCGSSGLLSEVAARLKRYELQGIVTPEIRKMPMVRPTFAIAAVDVSNFTGGSRATGRPHDAFYERLRSGDLPSIKTAREPTMIEGRFYSREHAKAIAPYERLIAPLLPEFCRWLWGTDIDPHSVVLVETPATSCEIRSEPLYLANAAVVKLLSPYCPKVKSILKNASHKDYAWLAPARRPNAQKGWYFEVLVALLVERTLAAADTMAELKKANDGTTSTLAVAMQRWRMTG